MDNTVLKATFSIILILNIIFLFVNINQTDRHCEEERPEDMNATWRQLLQQTQQKFRYSTDPAGTANKTLLLIASATQRQPHQPQWIAEGAGSFERCPNLMPWIKCSYSSNVSTNAEAVLFHGRYVHGSNDMIQQGRRLNRRQKWVFFETEPPTNVWNFVSANQSYWKWFNLTATFSHDSDIPVSNTYLHCLPRKNWKPSGVNHAYGKTKMAVWFVSHCRTSSKRELYVEEMQKHLSVDIFGQCGNQTTCVRDLSNLNTLDKCMRDLIEKTYKFYISFENAICSDYVTEKFLRVIRAINVIPVVLGGADYANILPKGSYIDIRDFSSVKELTEYLERVASDDALYSQYIEAKYSFHCVTYNTFMCDLCEYLHDHRYQTQLVYDAASFWSPRQRCVNPKEFFSDVAPEIVPNIKFYSNPELFI